MCASFVVRPSSLFASLVINRQHRSLCCDRSSLRHCTRRVCRLLHASWGWQNAHQMQAGSRLLRRGYRSLVRTAALAYLRRRASAIGHDSSGKAGMGQGICWYLNLLCHPGNRNNTCAITLAINQQTNKLTIVGLVQGIVRQPIALSYQRHHCHLCLRLPDMRCTPPLPASAPTMPPTVQATLPSAQQHSLPLGRAGCWARHCWTLG